MKKLGLMAVIIGIAMVSANADVVVNWQASGGFTWASAGDPAAEGILGEGTGNSCLLQLIWSADATADAAVDTGDYVSGDDVLLASFVFTEDGAGGGIDSWAFFGFGTSGTFNDAGANPDGGYIYGRIFQDDSVDFDDWYYTGVVDAAVDKTVPPGTPQEYDINRGSLSFGDDAIDDGTFGGQVVPEPTTWALFALGAVVVGLRRRKK